MPSRIDWCDESLNPLGHWCFGRGGTRENPKVCSYCFAERMAKRGMKNCELCRTFSVPHTHFEQLEKLARWKKPRTIFIQSMGDLFGSEVKDEWIGTVFDACKRANQHRYLFLTKHPERFQDVFLMDKLKISKNMWFGFSVSDQKMLNDMAMGARWLPANTFISIEPMHGEINLSKINPTGVDALLDFLTGGQYWLMGGNNEGKRLKRVIVGCETGSRANKAIPKREWITDIVNACLKANVPIFLKNNLAPIVGEEYVKAHQAFPWGGNSE